MNASKQPEIKPIYLTRSIFGAMAWTAIITAVTIWFIFYSDSSDVFSQSILGIVLAGFAIQTAVMLYRLSKVLGIVNRAFSRFQEIHKR